MSVAPVELKKITIFGIGSYGPYSTSLDIRPLTILCGENGSGKSTWIEVLRYIDFAIRGKTFPVFFDYGNVHGLFSADSVPDSDEIANHGLVEGMFDDLCKEEEDNSKTGMSGSFRLDMEILTDLEEIVFDSAISEMFEEGSKRESFKEALPKILAENSDKLTSDVLDFGTFKSGSTVSLKFTPITVNASRSEIVNLTVDDEEILTVAITGFSKPNNISIEVSSPISSLGTFTLLMQLDGGALDIDTEHESYSPFNFFCYTLWMSNVRQICTICLREFVSISAMRDINRKMWILQEDESAHDRDLNQESSTSTHKHTEDDILDFLVKVAESPASQPMEDFINTWHSHNLKDGELSVEDSIRIQKMHLGRRAESTHLFIELFQKNTYQAKFPASISPNEPEFKMPFQRYFERVNDSIFGHPSPEDQDSTLPVNQTPHGFLENRIPETVVDGKVELDSDGSRLFYGQHNRCFEFGCIPRYQSTGFHQLVPIIVQSMLLRAGQTFAIENPEAHIHPSLQTRIMEFIIGEAAIGKKYIIETHSDLIVKRVLRAVLEEELSQHKVAIYFTSLDKAGDIWRSKMELLEVDDKGRISNWPKGFMDEEIMESRRLIDAMYGHDEDTDDGE